MIWSRCGVPTDRLYATSTYLTCGYFWFTRYQHTPHLCITSDPLNGIGFACVCIIFRCVNVMIICRLSLGSVTLDVAMGTPCGFLQQLVTVQLDHKVPEMVVLGQLSHRLVCTPDLEILFSSGSTKR